MHHAVQALKYFSDLSMYSQFISISLVQKGPKLDAVFKVLSHKYEAGFASISLPAVLSLMQPFMSLALAKKCCICRLILSLVFTMIL